MKNLVGKTYTFSDGNSIEVTQVKLRDGNEYYVTYMIKTGPGIPRKLVLSLHEFTAYYGHLFGMDSDGVS